MQINKASNAEQTKEVLTWRWKNCRAGGAGCPSVEIRAGQHRRVSPLLTHKVSRVFGEECLWKAPRHAVLCLNKCNAERCQKNVLCSEQEKVPSMNTSPEMVSFVVTLSPACLPAT